MSIKINESNGQNIGVDFIGFSGGERHIQLQQLPDKKPEILNVYCCIRSSNDLMDLLLLQNALDNHYGHKIRMNLELPYLPYARQDRVCAEGQAFSLQLMAQILTHLHLKRLLVWDCHSDVSVQLTQAINVEATEIIGSCKSLLKELKSDQAVLICPDKGAINRCQKVVDHFSLKPMVVCEKIRDPNTGKITHTEVKADDLNGKTAIITDDICDGGYSFIKIAEHLKNKNVEKVILYVTHGIFSKGLSVFNGLIDEVYTTESFSQPVHEKLKIISFQSKPFKTILGACPRTGIVARENWFEADFSLI